MLSPKPVSHTNMEEIRDYFKYADKHMSLAQFSTTYLWRHSTGLLYDIQDDFLYLFEKNYNYAAPLPLGNGDIYKTTKLGGSTPNISPLYDNICTTSLSLTNVSVSPKVSPLMGI
jgi:hypothetical protein